MARPKGATHTAVLHVRLNAEDMERLRSEAEEAGRSVSEHARRRFLSPTKAAAPPAADRLAASLAYELNKIGTNLNQLAKSANLGGNPLPDLAAALDELRAALRKILQ